MTSLRNLILVVAVVFTKTCVADSIYDDHELISVTPRTPAHIEYLGKLELEYEELDFWNHPMLNETTRILVPPHLLATFKDLLDKQDIEWTVDSKGITSLIDASRGSDLFTVVGQSTTGSFHKKYHGYKEIKSYLEKMQKKYPNNMEISTLGRKTYESRSVVLVKLTGGKPPNGQEKKSIIIEGGVHAREWISPAVTVYAIEKMLEGYSAGNKREKDMLDKYDWYFVPVANPDGYLYTHINRNTRLWRKNRRQISTSCYGVDLNRNFDIHHGGVGTSRDCRSIFYPGPRAFSEAETSNLRDLFFKLRRSLIAYISVHSYSQVILLPWIYSSTHQTPPNNNELRRVASLMSQEMRRTSGLTYYYGSARSLIGYAAAGTSTDWAIYQKPGIYSMCIELRPDRRSQFGFLLPPNYIVPTGKEFYASLKALAKEMRS